MNTLPLQYVICRQAVQKFATVLLSEFAGCSEFLGGAIKINPWDTDMLGKKLYQAIMRNNYEKEVAHNQMCQYILSSNSRLLNKYLIHIYLNN